MILWSSYHKDPPHVYISLKRTENIFHYAVLVATQNAHAISPIGLLQILPS